MTQKSVASLGEFGLLDRIQKNARPWRSPNYSNARARGGNRLPFTIQVPNGDDAFVAKLSPNSPLVITTDTLLEGTHFNLKYLSNYLTFPKQWHCLGYKAMAVNLSDLAAMGNVSPLWAFVTLGIRGDISVDIVDNLYTGLTEWAQIDPYILAGGDMIRSEKSIISITLIGKVDGGMVLTRQGARIGDVLMASGPLGLSAAGLKILMKREKSKQKEAKTLIESHLYPVPRFDLSRILSREDTLATSILDTSDDLMTSLQILAKKSGVGFQVDLDSAPVPSALADFAAAEKQSPYDFVLYGGEDYQLLFTIPADRARKVLARVPGTYALGRVTSPARGIDIRLQGKPWRGKDVRFKHF